MSNLKFAWPVRVYFEDTDSGGVIYHANYLKFLKRARTEWLRALGFEQTALKTELRILFVVYNMSIAFKSPALFNNTLEVQSQLIKVGYSSMIFLQKIMRCNEALVEAIVKIACVDAIRLKPVGLPVTIKSTMRECKIAIN